jgi:hypothetical protein
MENNMLNIEDYIWGIKTIELSISKASTKH